jgi:hypothetical protein
MPEVVASGCAKEEKGTGSSNVVRVTIKLQVVRTLYLKE